MFIDLFLRGPCELHRMRAFHPSLPTREGDVSRMAKNQHKRLPPGKIEADENGFSALQTINGYTPINNTYSLDSVCSAHEELRALRRAAAAAQSEAQAARDSAVAKEWEFHNLMLGVKRKSDYKPPKRKSRAGAGTE